MQVTIRFIANINLEDIVIGDRLIVFPYEVCPVEGVVEEGHGSMDEAYLTGEPFEISKALGSDVISGTINNNTAFTIISTKLPVYSRYAKIMKVMEMTEQNRTRLRRMGDRLGAWYRPIAVGIAGASWLLAGNPQRFLAVMVIAPPCPLLIAIPVVVIGAISLAARRGIVIKNPAALEQVDSCTTLIFDKTGTLTYGTPTLTEVICAPGFSRDLVLGAAASLERYSKHPLAGAILAAAKREGLLPQRVEEVSEKPDPEPLQSLKAQLDFIEKQGYRQPGRTPWRPPAVFLDSPTCLNFETPYKAHPCDECVLIRFVRQ